MLKHVDQAYRIDQGLKNGVAADADELALVCQLRGRLTAIAGAVKRLWLYMQLCAPEDYHKAGRTLSDIQSVERKLDLFVEVRRRVFLFERSGKSNLKLPTPRCSSLQLVRNEELGAQMPLGDLQKVGTVLEALVAVAIPAQARHAEDVQGPAVEVR